MVKKDRRVFLRRLAGLTAAGVVSRGLYASMLTPRQSAGPFYPSQLPLDNDNDLVHVAGQQTIAKGEITDLSGRLLDRNGKPLAGVRIEIWQCDANGRYRHPRDSGDQPIDAGFQGFGHTVSDQHGRYRFMTIKPVPYPGRTPHIHVAIYPDDQRPFVTQLYVAGEEHNQEDFLYRRVPVEARQLVTTAFFHGDTPGLPLQARWDVILGS